MEDYCHQPDRNSGETRSTSVLCPLEVPPFRENTFLETRPDASIMVGKDAGDNRMERAVKATTLVY